MTEEQKRLLEKYSGLFTTNEPITEVLEEVIPQDVSLPSSPLDLSSKPTGRVQRDEATLTYDELIEEFYFFKKSAVMKPETFNRLWNS
jgi:hypothetical protein